MAEVFISYAREDQGFARDLHAALQKVNRDTWIDWRSIPDSAKWRAEIFAAIEAADNFLFIISADSVKSWMCGQEVSHAVANNKRLITILYHSVERKELLPALAEIQWIDYPNLGFEETFQRLIKALDTNFEWEHKHTQFLGRAAEWESKNRDQGFLLHGMELKEAIHWLEQAATIKGRKPTGIQEQYIRASEEWEAGEIERLKEFSEHETRQKKRFRRYSLVLAGVLLLTFLAAGFAFWQRAVARARELISASMASQNADPEISLLIAAQGVAATWPWGHAVLPEAQQPLHDAILASHVRLTLSGHRGVVTSVGWSPDGRRLATASAAQTVKVWDAATGKELLTLSDVSGVTSVAWSPDGRRLATASYDQTAKVWDAATGKELLTLNGHRGPVWGVAWSPDGKRLATGSEDQTAKVWGAATGKELLTLNGHRGPVWSVAWSPDGKRLATGSVEQTAKVWDAATGKEVLTLSGHGGRVWSVAWSPDGQRLATASEDQTAKVWDAATGQEVLTLRGHSGRVNSVAWSPPQTGKDERLAT